VDDEQRDAVDYIAICRLQSAYADTVTRRAWAELSEQILPDAPIHIDTVTSPAVEVVGPEQFGTFVGGAVGRFEFFEFAILNQHVELRVGGDPDSARARLYMCELRQEASNGSWTNAFGVYRDDYRRIHGRWWIARRSYRSLARTGRGEVFAFPRHFEFD
jgi:hypothetical protein